MYIANANTTGARLISQKPVVEKQHTHPAPKAFEQSLFESKRDMIYKIAFQAIFRLSWLSKRQCPEMIRFPEETIEFPKIIQDFQYGVFHKLAEEASSQVDGSSAGARKRKMNNKSIGGHGPAVLACEVNNLLFAICTLSSNSVLHRYRVKYWEECAQKQLKALELDVRWRWKCLTMLKGSENTIETSKYIEEDMVSKLQEMKEVALAQLKHFQEMPTENMSNVRRKLQQRLRVLGMHRIELMVANKMPCHSKKKQKQVDSHEEHDSTKQKRRWEYKPARMAGYAPTLVDHYPLCNEWLKEFQTKTFPMYKAHHICGESSTLTRLDECCYKMKLDHVDEIVREELRTLALKCLLHAPGLLADHDIDEIDEWEIVIREGKSINDNFEAENEVDGVWTTHVGKDSVYFWCILTEDNPVVKVYKGPCPNSLKGQLEEFIQFYLPPNDVKAVLETISADEGISTMLYQSYGQLFVSDDQLEENSETFIFQPLDCLFIHGGTPFKVLDFVCPPDKHRHVALRGRLKKDKSCQYYLEGPSFNKVTAFIDLVSHLWNQVEEVSKKWLLDLLYHYLVEVSCLDLCYLKVKSQFCQDLLSFLRRLDECSTAPEERENLITDFIRKQQRISNISGC
jgi:hypothetical protein